MYFDLTLSHFQATLTFQHTGNYIPRYIFILTGKCDLKRLMFDK
jgi:hypothetical protein